MDQNLIEKFFDSIRLGDLKTVKEFIKEGIDINLANSQKYTPLMMAANYGHLEIVKYLVENDANLESIDKDGQTALVWASLTNNVEIVKYLLQFPESLKIIKNKEKLISVIFNSLKIFYKYIRNFV